MKAPKSIDIAEIRAWLDIRNGPGFRWPYGAEMLNVLEHLREIVEALSGDGYDEERIEYLLAEVLRLTEPGLPPEEVPW